MESAKKYEYGPTKDYSIKEGEKIHIAVDKVASRKSTTKSERRSSANASGAMSGGFLKPSSKDTPRRASALGD